MTTTNAQLLRRRNYARRISGYHYPETDRHPLALHPPLCGHLEVVKTIILLTTIFEYFFLLITLRHNEPARTFANQVATYGYRLMRYLTLNENQRPFPFSEFPAKIELPDEDVRFE